jgi:hypothetical protein
MRPCSCALADLHSCRNAAALSSSPIHVCRPPAAFKNLKSLSAGSPGHLLLLEYLEERPMLMLQPGMGMRLTTYYRCAFVPTFAISRAGVLAVGG